MPEEPLSHLILRAPITPPAALLQVLLQGPLYGLQIQGRLRELTEEGLFLSYGSVYTALKSLAEKGLVRSEAEAAPPRSGGRPRVFYHLTEPGLARARHDRQLLLQILSIPLPEASP